MAAYLTITLDLGTLLPARTVNANLDGRVRRIEQVTGEYNQDVDLPEQAIGVRSSPSPVRRVQSRPIPSNRVQGRMKP